MLLVIFIYFFNDMVQKYYTLIGEWSYVIDMIYTSSKQSSLFSFFRILFFWVFPFILTVFFFADHAFQSAIGAYTALPSLLRRAAFLYRFVQLNVKHFEPLSILSANSRLIYQKMAENTRKTVFFRNRSSAICSIRSLYKYKICILNQKHFYFINGEHGRKRYVRVQSHLTIVFI